jgi:general secretion pathway protein F
MVFSYKGVAKSGANVSGKVSADTYSEAMAQIKQKGILVSDIREASSAKGLSLSSSSPSFDDFEYITSELSLLLKSGVKIDRALKILERAKAGTVTGDLIRKLSDKVNRGTPISKAFGEFPEFFDPLYVNLLKIAEETATLPTVFSNLSEDMKFSASLRRKVKGALAYPLVIMSVCILSVVFIFNFVVPNLAGIFEGATDLPVYTQIILNLSDFFINYQWYLAFALIALGIYAFQSRKQAWFKHTVEFIFSRTPVLKKLFMQLQRIKFSSSVVLMLQAGIKIEQAVSFACNNLQSMMLQKEINYALLSIKRGEGIANSFNASRLFNDYYLSLIEVGEETANLENVFSEIVERSRSEFESSITKYLNMLEPLLILLMGTIVGSVVVTMMLSITSVTDAGF